MPGTSSRHAVPTAPLTVSSDAGLDDESLHRCTKHFTHCIRVGADPSITALTQPTSKPIYVGRNSTDRGRRATKLSAIAMSMASRSRFFLGGGGLRHASDIKIVISSCDRILLRNTRTPYAYEGSENVCFNIYLQ